MLRGEHVRRIYSLFRNIFQRWIDNFYYTCCNRALRTCGVSDYKARRDFLLDQLCKERRKACDEGNRIAPV